MITCKSTPRSLEFWLEETDSYAQIKQELIGKLEANALFYQGYHSPVIFFGKQFTELQKKEISAILLRRFDMTTVQFVDEEEAPAQKKPADKEVTAEKVSVSAPSKKEPPAENRFIKKSLRSGQRVECGGDVVVLGDVNPGAEIIAGGNIAVFGKLRGLAHAGAFGRTDVCIAAQKLLPQQVRICGKIGIIPQDRRIEGAETVHLEDGRIVVEGLE